MIVIGRLFFYFFVTVVVAVVAVTAITVAVVAGVAITIVVVVAVVTLFFLFCFCSYQQQWLTYPMWQCKPSQCRTLRQQTVHAYYEFMNA